MRDVFYLAFKALWTRRVRTILLILSVMVGITAIISLTSQAEGVGRSITSMLQKLGPDTLIISMSGRRLTDSDVFLIANVDEVKVVIPIVRDTWIMTIGGSWTGITIYGINPNQLSEILGDVKIIEGSLYPDTPIPLALIGYQVAYPNGTDRPLIVPGQAITLQPRSVGSLSSGASITLIASGILETYGAMSIISPDTSIFIPLQAAKLILNRGWYDLLIVKVNNVDSLGVIENNLRNIYGNSINVMSPVQMAQTMQSVVAQITLLLGGIAAISLISASMGILNMMLVTVTERTREIGTMKALGFKNKSILTQIVAEGLLIGLFGGILGVAVGTATSYLIPAFLIGGTSATQIGGPGRQTGAVIASGLRININYEPYINPTVILISLAIALIVSIASSIYPAWRAAKMDPVKALRYE